jgi:putative PIN family toxin of toxin-antitoxin system
VIVVLDTNVLVAALVAQGLCHEVVQRCVHAHAVVSSRPLLEELERALRERFSLTPQAHAFLRELRRYVQQVETAILPVPVCRDRDDDVVLATAVAANADIIVTGDEDLLVLREYEGVAILSPRQFLERVQTPSKR